MFEHYECHAIQYPENQKAFKRYEVPFGADQCKSMTVWTNKVARPTTAKINHLHDPIRAYIYSVTHRDSGSEGLIPPDFPTS